METLTVFKLDLMDEEELTALSGSTVRVKGFAYKTEEGRWILSDRPNLKCCCVGNEKNIRSQVVVADPFEMENTSRPVTLEGTIAFDPKISEGKLVQYTKLSGAQLVEEPADSSFFWMLGALAAAVCIGLWIRRKQSCKS